MYSQLLLFSNLEGIVKILENYNQSPPKIPVFNPYSLKAKQNHPLANKKLEDHRQRFSGYDLRRVT